MFFKENQRKSKKNQKISVISNALPL